MVAPANPFTRDDELVLARRGVSLEEARRQLALLSHPPGFVRLVRPCVAGDGIVHLDDARVDGLLLAHVSAERAGRVTTFVPASGAATRMFRDLLAALAAPGELSPREVAAAAAGGSAEAGVVQGFVEALPRFAFAGNLAAHLAGRGLDAELLRAQGPWRPLLAGLLEEQGLGYAELPKALLAFHREGDAVRTAFEEHLAESALLGRGADGTCRLHLTVSPEHLARFETLLSHVRARMEPRLGVQFEVRFSEQHPSTDTLAADSSGMPFRGPNGELLFRPAGHGALLRNLAESDADLVFLKNIDNVATDRLKPQTARWGGALVGLAAELSARAHALRARLEDATDSSATGEATAFLHDALGVPSPPDDARALADALDRPLRVCGMVPNTGEPGGGPFWVLGADGDVSRQIVEGAQIDPASPAQQQILGSATHFNPVFLAAALRDRHGRPHDLEAFVDPFGSIVTRKSAGGRELLALERPGLWNGAMARWNTVFVEVPLAVFNPVKTLFDLLRPEHQG